ncbi:hypothetical protein [Arthrobacter sp. ISL-30]|uniref:hypothetical protein n=1 Tax=Arthrobacter sp. ISL-30 TaxID=2819109 RepID=UPI001BEB31C1|nr:hypothetical protein [Arthrobacter sp. ISL-30]MBT2515439.1 hypothetical protein [Arthrobacter sp. ISL-30]
MRTGFKITLAGVVTAGAAAALLGLAQAPQVDFDDPSRIIPSLSNPQQEADKVPAEIMSRLDRDGYIGIDPSQTRRLGEVDGITFYGVAAGDKICMIPVDATGKDNGSMGCGLVKNAESGGLKLEYRATSQAAWLVVHGAAEKSLESVKGERGWSQLAPNFLVRSNK